MQMVNSFVMVLGIYDSNNSFTKCSFQHTQDVKKKQHDQWFCNHFSILSYQSLHHAARPSTCKRADEPSSFNDTSSSMTFVSLATRSLGPITDSERTTQSIIQRHRSWEGSLLTVSLKSCRGELHQRGEGDEGGEAAVHPSEVSACRSGSGFDIKKRARPRCKAGRSVAYRRHRSSPIGADPGGHASDRGYMDAHRRGAIGIHLSTGARNLGV